jgi:hypothetical protein
MKDLARPAGLRLFFAPGALLLLGFLAVVCATARSSHHSVGRTGKLWTSLNVGPFTHSRNNAGNLASASRLPFVSRQSSSVLEVRGGAAPGAEEPKKEEPTEESTPEAVELYLPGLLETVIQRIRKVRKNMSGDPKKQPRYPLTIMRFPCCA